MCLTGATTGMIGSTNTISKAFTDYFLHYFKVISVVLTILFVYFIAHILKIPKKGKFDVDKITLWAVQEMEHEYKQNIKRNWKRNTDITVE